MEEFKAKYRIAYRYTRYNKYDWSNFNYLNELRFRYYYILKHCRGFKIFVLKGDKYVTLMNKKRFLDLLQKEIRKKMFDAGHKSMLIKNYRDFRATIEDNFKRDYR
jgi:hypothetical protein